jgi:hypothetical protein
MSRFVKLEAVSVDEQDGSVSFYELRINPFQVESFYETDITYDSIETMERMTDRCCSITTKSGDKYTVMGNSDTIEQRLTC